MLSRRRNRLNRFRESLCVIDEITRDRRRKILHNLERRFQGNNILSCRVIRSFFVRLALVLWVERNHHAISPVRHIPRIRDPRIKFLFRVLCQVSIKIQRDVMLPTQFEVISVRNVNGRLTIHPVILILIDPHRSRTTKRLFQRFRTVIAHRDLQVLCLIAVTRISIVGHKLRHLQVCTHRAHLKATDRHSCRGHSRFEDHAELNLPRLYRELRLSNLKTVGGLGQLPLTSTLIPIAKPISPLAKLLPLFRRPLLAIFYPEHRWRVARILFVCVCNDELLIFRPF